MDANIHINEKELSLAILSILDSSTIDVNIYDGNFGEVQILDPWDRKITKVVKINDYRIKEEESHG